MEEILCIVVLENGKSLSSCVHPIRYLNEPLLPYESILNNTIFSISTLSILIGILFLWKVFLLIQSSPKIKAFCSILYHVNIKRQNCLWLVFSFTIICFGIHSFTGSCFAEKIMPKGCTPSWSSKYCLDPSCYRDNMLHVR